MASASCPFGISGVSIEPGISRRIAPAEAGAHQRVLVAALVQAFRDPAAEHDAERATDDGHDAVSRG